MELWVGCVAGAYSRTWTTGRNFKRQDSSLSRSKADSASITWRMPGSFSVRRNLDVNTIASQVEGKFISAPLCVR